MVPAQKRPACAESISSSSPKQSGSDSTLDQNRLPSSPVDVTFGIAQTSPTTFPSVLHPEGLWFQGVRRGSLVHYQDPTTIDLRKQEIRISRLTGILD
jgi:hypothetical protein